MRMTAAVMQAQGLPAPFAESQPFHIDDVDLEGPGEDEVLLEVRAAGLCHSDLSVVAGMRKRIVPVVGGHEGAGIVREVGKGVTTLKAGDHVVMSNFSSCGHCRYCNDSKPVLCEDMGAFRSQGMLANGNIKMTYRGKPIFHYSGVSSFAQYAVMMPQSLLKVDDSIPLDIAAMFGCAVITGAGCVFNAAKLRPGQHAAVFGLGGVGLNTVMAARIAGAAKIIGIDINKGKFPLAEELGCTETLDATDPHLVETVRDLTGGGVDFAFEMSGARAAMAQAVAVTAKGGEIICVGLGASNDMYQYAHAALVSQEKVFRGTEMGSSVPARDIPRYLQMYKDGKLQVDRLKSGTMSFGELNMNLDLLDRGAVLRQILHPHG